MVEPDHRLFATVHPCVLLSTGCLVRNDWICGEYIRSRRPELQDALTQHITLTVVAVVVGLAVAVPLAILARRLHLTHSSSAPRP